MKRMTVLIVAGLMALSVLLTACTPTGGEVESGAMEGETKTLFVGPELVECTGVAPQQCLQVREDPNADYELFYNSIEGFTFEPGYEYELLVRVDTVANPPADGSSLQYTLVEVVEVADHPWFLAVQYHPAFKSKPLAPHPLFKGFVGAAIRKHRGES